MAYKGPDITGPSSSEQPIRVELSPGEKEDIRNEARKFIDLDRIKRTGQRALDIIEWNTNVRDITDITVTKIGVVPSKPPNSHLGEALPADIKEGDLFVSGRMVVPIPVCEPGQDEKSNDENGDPPPTWKPLEVGFSLYRKQSNAKPQIIFAIWPYKQSSEFLKPRMERVAERQEGFRWLTRHVYHNKIPAETFHGLKEKLEPIYERWLWEHVQKMVDKGEFKRIVEAVEKDKSLFRHSDIQIDTHATEDSMDTQLNETLRTPTPFSIPSAQVYVGEDAQAGWLNLCRAPSYSLSSREMDLLRQNADKISEATADTRHVMMFGLGDAEKERFLIGRILEKRCPDSGTLDVHGIDVGLHFHQNALEGMKEVRDRTGKDVGYRGHVDLFENAEKIGADMRTSPDGSKDSTLRFTLGNTFCNFDDPWAVFAAGMVKGDKLMITSDIIPSPENLGEEEKQQRDEKIRQIVARYDIPEWKEWVLSPLYRAGFRGRIFHDNVKVEWDEARRAIVFTYKFTNPVDNGNGIRFDSGEEIRLYMSKKLDQRRFEKEAGNKGFKINELLKNDSGDFGCFILEKV